MKFVDRAIKISFEMYPFSEETFSHYCFIFDKNRLISIGKNNTKTQSMKARYFANRFNIEHFKKYSYIHAEVGAIGKLWGKQVITGKERVVVIRVGKTGLLNSYPCVNCSAILKSIGFNSVFHSTPKGVIESAL